MVIFTGTENRDSGVADIEVYPCQCPCAQSQGIGGSENAETMGHEVQIKRSALSNSLLDIHEQCKSVFTHIETNSIIYVSV